MNLKILLSVLAILFVSTGCTTDSWERNIKIVGSISDQQYDALNYALDEWDSGDVIDEYSLNTIQFVSKKQLDLIDDEGHKGLARVRRWRYDDYYNEIRIVDVFVLDSLTGIDLKKVVTHEIGHFIMYNSCETYKKGFDDHGHLETWGNVMFSYVDGIGEHVTNDDREIVCLIEKVEY